MLLLAGCGQTWINPGSLPHALVIDQMALPIPTYAQNNKEASIQPYTYQPSNQYTLTIEPIRSLTIERYGLLELELQTDLPIVNPYDQSEIDLRVRFTSPSGKNMEAGAFWYQGYDPQTRQPKGEPGWKVRFTPRETGLWVAVARAPSSGLHSQAATFKVIASNRPGFVRVHPDNSHYLAFDNGDFFFPIGLNMAWSRGWRDPIEDYSHWLDSFSANGGNTIRVWMAAWSFGIEWKDTGLGNYDLRQYEAWMLDEVFSLAEAQGVKIILVLVNHGPFSLTANSEWNDNPYNAALGGPLTTPEQFVSDPVAKSYFQRRLSYIINRWSYSPDLLAWEWFNEVDLTPISDQALIPWLQEMTAYLRQRDVNHHLTTNSFAMHSWSSVWQLPELDIVQRHEYSTQYLEDDRDPVGRATQDFQALALNVPEKPILLAEFGYSASDYGDDVETSGIHLHNGLWATTFSGYAGSGMYWWWDTYIEPNDLWKHFKSLSSFLNGEDLTQYQSFSPLILSISGSTASQAYGLGLRGEKTMLWLRSDSYTTQAATTAQYTSGVSTVYVPPLVDGLFVTLDGMVDGDYTVSWYDPQSSVWLAEATITSQISTLTIPVPSFRYDLAAKIVREP